MLSRILEKDIISVEKRDNKIHVGFMKILLLRELKIECTKKGLISKMSERVRIVLNCSILRIK